MKKNTKEENKPSLKIIPLGGLEQIGMNITAFESEDSIIVVDCGLAFPEDDMFGVDLVIPDTTYLEQNIEKIKGFVITHGHEDHIGALPYVLQKINVPVFATRLTMGIIENKLKERGMLETTQRKVVKFGSSVNLGCFRVEFIKTNHSIVDAAALTRRCSATRSTCRDSRSSGARASLRSCVIRPMRRGPVLRLRSVRSEE